MVLFDNAQIAGTSQIITIGKHELAFQWCPQGEFMMGSSVDDARANFFEKPQTKVKIPTGFWIGTFLVTQELWLEYMEPETSIISAGSNLPATAMTWQQARIFCTRLTDALQREMLLHKNQVISLPTEAQWEYATRAGTTTRWYFGEDVEELDQHAWYEVNSKRARHPVGEKLSNPWGLYDVYGNVAEWCINDNDLYNTIIREGIFTTTTESFRKVARGGSCQDSPNFCCSPARYAASETNPYNDEIGLRIICQAL